MRRKTLYFIKEVAIFVVIVTIAANLLSFYKSGDLNKESLSIKQVSLMGDTNYTINTDKPVLIHFWATWCPTCSLEASNIQNISEKYEVITIAVKSNKDEIDKYMKENYLDFKVVNDENAYLAREFKISAYPTTFIYNKEKDLIFSEVGYTSSLGLYLRMWWAGL